jgi:hypothetical protein
MDSETLASYLAHCLLESLEPGAEDFRWHAFFRQWFREQGNPYYFLFNQHLGVTNAQPFAPAAPRGGVDSQRSLGRTAGCLQA